MPRLLLFCIVFIEGFCSLGAEIIALRRLVPHVGSAIVVTAPTIGLFLLALALGYAAGARVAGRFTQTVARNFLLSAGLAGLGLARVSVDSLFMALQPVWLAYLVFVGGVLCPLAWLLGQTVPILTNLMKHMRTGEASGYALYWSTLGSFLGSVSLSLWVMQWLGVSAAVLICATLLALGSLLLAQPGWQRGSAAALAVAAAVWSNLMPRTEVLDTAYADYRVQALPGQEAEPARAFMVNNSLASLLGAGESPRYARYVQHLRHLILQEWGWRGREILVLGAGGFTLSHQEPENRYTYVDIDARIRDIAEQRFLQQPIQGRFVVDDARRFVHRTTQRFDAVVVDAYSSHTSIPSHLITQEFWHDTRRALTAEGWLLINLILDSRLQSPYARTLLNTIESVYGRCSVEVLQNMQDLSNVIVSCHASSQAQVRHIYTDEQNAADLDRALGQ